MKKAGSPKAGARRLERQRSREIFGSLDSAGSGGFSSLDSAGGRSQDCGSPVAPLVGFLARAESESGSVESFEQPARGKISAEEDGEKTPASPSGGARGFGSVVSAEEAELAKAFDAQMIRESAGARQDGGQVATARLAVGKGPLIGGGRWDGETEGAAAAHAAQQ